MRNVRRKLGQGPWTGPLRGGESGMNFARSIFAGLAAMLLLTRPGMAQPDPVLVAAALKEGEVVWYSTLIVNQIVRPLPEN